MPPSRVTAYIAREWPSASRAIDAIPTGRSRRCSSHEARMVAPGPSAAPPLEARSTGWWKVGMCGGGSPSGSAPRNVGTIGALAAMASSSWRTRMARTAARSGPPPTSVLDAASRTVAASLEGSRCERGPQLGQASRPRVHPGPAPGEVGQPDELDGR